MVVMEMGKRKFLVTMATAATRKKSFTKNLNLVDLNYHYKNSVDWTRARRHNMKMYIFRKRARKLKHNSFTFCENLPQFRSYNRNWLN